MYTEYGDSSVTVCVMFNSDFVTETEMHHTDDMKINSDCELLYTQKELYKAIRIVRIRSV